MTGARKFLIAYNINLNTPDVTIAKAIAKTIRFSSGGFRYVKSMGVMLASRNLAQVSINLTDFEQTPMHLVFEAVRREAERYGVGIVGSEIVGLIPRRPSSSPPNISCASKISSPSSCWSTASPKPWPPAAGSLNSSTPWRHPPPLPAEAAPRPPRPPWPPHSAAMVTRLAKLPCDAFEDDRHFFTEAVDRDAEAFNQVMAAYKRPKAERAPYVEEALHGAAEVPLQVLERTHALQQRLDALEIPARFASDLNVAKALAIAARTGARENVEINLAEIHDEAFKSAIAARLAQVG